MTLIGRPPITRERAMQEGWYTPNPSGLCGCGCGKTTPTAKKTLRNRGVLRGEPMRFLRGHAPQQGSENPNWKGDQAGYAAVHRWLGRTFPKMGTCEWCQETAATEYALMAEEHTRDREAYAELCVPCHRGYDHDGERSGNAKLTLDDVRLIRQRIAAGASDRTLSAEMGVSPAAVWMIRTGKTWKQVA